MRDEIRRLYYKGYTTDEVVYLLCLGKMRRTKKTRTLRIPKVVREVRMEIINKYFYNIEIDRLSDANIKYIEHLYVDGYSVEDISIILELSETFITNSLYGLGFKKYPRRFSDKDIITFLRKGCTTRDICKMINNYNTTFRVRISLLREGVDKNYTGIEIDELGKEKVWGVSKIILDRELKNRSISELIAYFKIRRLDENNFKNKLNEYIVSRGGQILC